MIIEEIGKLKYEKSPGYDLVLLKMLKEQEERIYLFGIYIQINNQIILPANILQKIYSGYYNILDFYLAKRILKLRVNYETLALHQI